MRFELEVGDREKTRMEFFRSPWWGTVEVRANGQLVAARSPWDPSTHVNVALVKRYEFSVGERETHEVLIEHERPLLLAGFRRHTYRVYVDGRLVGEHYGF